MNRDDYDSGTTSVKQVINLLVNDTLLRPFGLKLSFRTGSNPIEDMAQLLSGHSVSIIVDGGAYEGSVSREISRTFPTAKIQAFEPTPASYSRLKRNTQSSAAILCHQLALGSQRRTATLFMNASPLTNSLRKSTSIGHHYFRALVADQEAIEVQVVT
jgi:FkbM family methyltransferase